ncbi:uncharacterized protein LOC135212846 [Macrobrachium nipponense]|uniref:uncharacterized protein LOC135212846 n=1 Tax=Macrobrachium nipponense TaxID=159736 RepID=UPI0030C7BEF7
MSEATPEKRKREEDDDYNGDGAVDGDFIHRCIKLKDPETIRMTIRQRRYWEFTHTEDGMLSYLIPLNWLEFFTYTTKGTDGTPGKTVRWDKVDTIAENFGLKIHKAGIVMHSLIPMQQALTVQSGTAVGTLTMNTTPYLEIYKDSNCTYGGCQSKDGTTFQLKDWLWNPQIQQFGEGKEY